MLSNAQNTVTPEFMQSELSKARPFTLAFFNKGTAPEEKDPQQAERTQMMHLQYLFTLKESKQVSIFGPLTDDGRIRGIVIFNTTDHELVKRLLDADPQVRARNLSYELHAWFGIAGQTLAGL